MESASCLWTAFQYYVIPVLMYCSPVWNSLLQRDIDVIERVQRRFTKRISGLQHLPYEERLRKLNALSLQKLRTFANIITIHKSLRSGMSADFGLSLASASTRSGGTRLVQRRATKKIASSLFYCRAPSTWNKLPISLVLNYSKQSLSGFKKSLKKHLNKFPV